MSVPQPPVKTQTSGSGGNRSGGLGDSGIGSVDSSVAGGAGSSGSGVATAQAASARGVVCREAATLETDVQQGDSSVQTLPYEVQEELTSTANAAATAAATNAAASASPVAVACPSNKPCFVAYSFNTQVLTPLFSHPTSPNASLSVALRSGESDIVTMCRVLMTVCGLSFAPIGFMEFFNGGAGILSCTCKDSSSISSSSSSSRACESDTRIQGISGPDPDSEEDPNSGRIHVTAGSLDPDPADMHSPVCVEDVSAADAVGGGPTREAAAATAASSGLPDTTHASTPASVGAQEVETSGTAGAQEVEASGVERQPTGQQVVGGSVAISLVVRGSGRLLLYSSVAPTGVVIDGEGQESSFDAATCKLVVSVPMLTGQATRNVSVRYSR
ncbi:MAG: hypothetical protein WDW38_002089 [Sanguina aurantia]